MTSVQQPAGGQLAASSVAPTEELEDENGSGAQWVDDLLSARTRDLIHKRRSGRTPRRGGVIRRALAGADNVGLLCAFAVAELVFGPEADASVDRFGTGAELAGFALSLPLWLLLA